MAVIVFPLTTIGILAQDKWSLPDWLYGIWYFLTIIFCVEVWHRVGPEGASRSFFDVTGLSFKDKAIYLLWIITMFVGVIVIEEFSNAVSNLAIKLVLIVIFVGLCYLLVWLFGSPELKQKLSGKKK